MVIKDLFTKLIKDPKTRKDVEAMISGKGKILQEEAFDERGKAYEKYTPLIAQTEVDIKNFNKFNTSNMQKNIADSLYKYYKQKQKEIYKKYVKSIMSATEFYNKELDSMYGEGFSDTFVSLKEKEEAYIKMKSLVDSGAMQGSKEMNRINNIRNSAGYNANKKKAESIIKEIEALRQMKMRQQHHATNVSKEDLDVNKLKDNLTDLIEQNEMIIDQIQEVREENKTTISSLIDDSLADLEEMRTAIKESSKIKGKSELSEKILDKMEKLDKAKDAFNVDDILKGAEEVFSLLDTVSKKSEEAISENGSTLLQIKKKKETLDKMPLTRKKTRAKLEQSIKEDEEKFNALPKAQQDSMRAQLEVYELIKKNADSLRNKLLHQDLSTQTITQQYNTGNRTSGVDIVRINQGSLINAIQNMKGQDTESSVEDSAKKLEEMRSRVIDSQQSSIYENQVNSMNNQMGKLEGTILKPSEYMEQMAREFGSYMLRVRMVQRGIQDIVGAISEFQKIDDEAFQLGMVSDLNIGSIRRYRNEILGLATDYRATAEEIVSSQSEVIKSGRTFEQAKQQVSASLILSRVTFEDLNNASDTLNKLMLTLEMNGNKSYETMSKLYNVVQNTPASLAGMEASMRQSSAAFSGLLDNIDYSGAQLEEYQGKLRDAELALVGFVNLQGKTPQMAGTAVKTLVDKMRSPTEKAKTQINTELRATGAMYEGSQVTSDTISRLAETDFPQAIDLLSKLYINGNLTYQAIQDMFGPRNAATLSKLLYQVNGDLEKNSDRMLNKLDPVRDSEKLMKSWSEEMEELKNSFRALKGIANDFGDALLPAISITGDFVAGLAKEASGDSWHSTVTKSALQVGTAGYGIGKLGTNAMLSMYSLNQSNLDNVAEGKEGLFAIGELFKKIGEESNGAKMSLTTLHTAIKSLAEGTLQTLKGIWSFISSGAGAAIIAVGLLATTIVSLMKIASDNMSKANQSSMDSVKSLEAREQALQAENDILKSLTKTMESLNPSAFKASDSISLLTQEIKNMLDTTLEYTDKLSAFTKKLWSENILKEIDDTIKNKDTSEEDRAKAERKKEYLKEYVKSGTEPTEKQIADTKRKAKIYTAISAPESVQKEDLIELGIISKQNAEKYSTEEIRKGFLKLRGSWVNDKKGRAYEDMHTTQEMNNIDIENAFSLNGNLKDEANKLKAQSEIWDAYQQAKTANLESINSAIAKEVKEIQDINNYINSLIVEKQKSVFNESGDYLSVQNRLDFMSKDSDLRPIIENNRDLMNKISDITAKDAFDYVSKVALIKKQENMINQSLMSYSDLLSDKRGKDSGKNILGNDRQISNMIGKIVEVKSKDSKSFEQATGITTKQLRGVLKDSSSTDIVMQRLKEMAIKNGKEIDTVMEKSLSIYLKSQASRFEKTIRGVTVNFSAEKAKVSDVFTKDGTLVKGLVGRIDALEEILIKTTDEILAQKIISYLQNVGDASLKDVLGARATYKKKQVIPIITAANEMDRAMNALILASKNKLLEISAQLTNATIKMNNMGAGKYIENAEEEKRKQVEQWRQQAKVDFIQSTVADTEKLTKEERNKITNLVLPSLKAENPSQRPNYIDYFIAGRNDKDKDLSKDKDYIQWTSSRDAIDLNNSFNAKFADRESAYKASATFTDKVIKERGSKAEVMARNVERAVSKTGEIDLSKIKYTGTELEKAIGMANSLSSIMKASYDSLNISQTAREESIKANTRAIEDNNIEIKYSNSLSGAQGTAMNTFKSISQRNVDLGRGVSDKYSYLKDEKYQDKIARIQNSSSLEGALKTIMEYQGISDKAKSSLKDYAEVYFTTLRESSKVQNEFIEQFRKLKNELITDTFNINQLTGKGKTSESAIDIKASVDKYYTNLIEISKAQLELNDAISKGVIVSFDKEGKASIKTEGATPKDIEKLASTSLKNISNFSKENENLLPTISAFVTDMNKTISGEFDIEKLVREIASFDASAVISKTPKSEAEQQKNDKIYEARTKANNLYLQSYNDILAPLSSFPNIQKEISENQVKILENMKAELVERDKTLKRSTDIVDIKKLEGQIVAAQLEKQKQLTQSRISMLEDEKKLLSLRKENAIMLGNVNAYSPSKNLEDNMRFAKEQLMISLEQIKIEEEAKRTALAQIGSMGELKSSIDTLTETVLKSLPGYKAEGQEFKLNPITSITDFDKNKKTTTNNLSMESLKENVTTDSSNTTKIIEVTQKLESDNIINNYKQRIAYEEYINNVYKARSEYAKQTDEKYGKTMDNIQALISGNFSAIKAEPQSLRKSMYDLTELKAYTSPKSIENMAKTKLEGYFKNYDGDVGALGDILGNEEKANDFISKNIGNLNVVSDKKASEEAKKKAMDELMNSAQEDATENEKKITRDKKISTYANLAVSITNQIASAYETILNSKLANQMEGLQAEEKVLNARKAGYRTELAKQQIDEQIYQNKLKQIETQQKIDQASSGNAVGGVLSGIGAGLMSVNPIAGAIVQVASPFIAQAIGSIDSDAKMKAEQAKADLATEKNYKEYNDFWTLFFNTIKGITQMASQNIDNLASDYASGRNLSRLNYGIRNQNDINSAVINSLNDFQGLGTLDEQYQTKSWYGKKKTKHITTGMNYTFEDLSLDQMKELAGMDASSLKAVMINELKKDNTVQQIGTATSDSAGEKIFGDTLAHTGLGALTGGLSNMLNLFGGSKFKGATWDVLDSDVTDFQESLKEAISTIEYLSREINSLADKIYYADKEGYASTSQEDISAKYTELIANAKTAGNTSLADTLQLQYDAEMKKFVDAGVSDIYYSTFSSILMEAAKKVGKESGDFSDAYASGIGEAFGTQFGNIITEIMDRAVGDNSELDDYMLKFAEKLKAYTGDISLFIKDGVLDVNSMSEYIGAGSMTENLVSSAKKLTTLESIDMYKTSNDMARQLRNKGLSENEIATFLKTSGLTDTLKVAVEKLSDVFNPIGMSSADIAMQRESFNSSNSKRMEELRRKKLIGPMSSADAKELTSLESKDMKLSIKENVVAGFESGIKSALGKERYSDVFAEFGGTIGDSIKNSIMANLDYSDETSAIAELISNGDIESASSKLTGLSMKIMKDSKSMKSTINELRNNGMDWTEIEALGLSSNEYSAIEDILKGNESLKQSIAKYEKELYNYNNKMATDKYTSEEYYAELTKRIARNEELTTSEQEWYEEYETGLNKVIVKQNLLNSLAGNLNGILSNSSGLNFLKTIGTSIGESLNGIIVKSLKADEIMQSLVEKISSGQDTRKEMSALSSLYSYAKYKQESMRKSMIKSGNSYSFVESVFGENASSKVADVYMEMKRYTDLLGAITKEENNYKESLLSLNGITFTYEEYYRELALRKANNIKLTEQEVAWMDKYSESINEFQINSSIVTDFYSALTSSFGKTTNQEIFEEFANGFIETIRAKIVDGYLGGELSEDMASAISLAQEAASTGTISDLYNAQQKLIQLSSQIQVAKQQSQGLIDMFDSTKLVDFTDKTKDIQYSASSSKDITYNITQNLTLSAGSVIGDGVSLEKLAKVLAPMLKPEIAKIK